jgi:hypothetical protein
LAELESLEGPKLSSKQTEPKDQDRISEQANPKTTMTIVHDNEKKKKKEELERQKSKSQRSIDMAGVQVS